VYFDLVISLLVTVILYLSHIYKLVSPSLYDAKISIEKKLDKISVKIVGR